MTDMMNVSCNEMMYSSQIHICSVQCFYYAVNRPLSLYVSVLTVARTDTYTNWFYCLGSNQVNAGSADARTTAVGILWSDFMFCTSEVHSKSIVSLSESLSGVPHCHPSPAGMRASITNNVFLSYSYNIVIFLYYYICIIVIFSKVIFGGPPCSSSSLFLLSYSEIQRSMHDNDPNCTLFLN